MGVVTPIGSVGARRDPVLDGEHPDVVLADLVGRSRPKARIITVANEKGGVGKTTLAFHLAVALADCGNKVLAVDLDRRQQTLNRALTNRDGTARRLGARLPLPRHVLLTQHSGAMLCQEIARSGWDCDYVIIDAPGYDSPIARRAIALADQLLTPVGSSHADIDLLGRFDITNRRFLGAGCYAALVNELRAARLAAGLNDIDWLVLPNRRRQDASRNREVIAGTLDRLAAKLNFRLGNGLSERVAYRELLPLGLVHLDLHRIPALPRSRGNVPREIMTLLDDLQDSAGAKAVRGVLDIAGTAEPMLALA